MNSDLQRLGTQLVGRWNITASHPMLPGEPISGSCSVEWLDGETFLVHRSKYDHPQIPNALAVIGDTDGLRMHYFDERGVHRIYQVSVTPAGWEMSMPRDSVEGSFASGVQQFSQRVSYSFDDNGHTMSGNGQMSFDDVHWEDDLQITYRKVP